MTNMTNPKPTSGHRTYRQWLLCTAALLAAAQAVHGQSILGTNLIVNGGAEAGPAGTGTTNIVTSVPGWTRTGNANVLPYGLAGGLLLSDPAPSDHGFQYFVAPANNLSTSSTLTQDIDVSSGASIISVGNVKYTASAYLGSLRGSAPAQMTVAFKNASGQTFSSAALGPLTFPGNGMSLQRQIGLVPAGTARITVTLTLSLVAPNVADLHYGVADSLSLVLGTPPGPILGTNLVVNGGAEAGPGVPSPNFAPYIPGWSSNMGASVSPYAGSRGFITSSDPGPADRGVNVFYGGPVATTSDIYQDIDVSLAATLIDAGQVVYLVSAWLGALALHQSPTLTYSFFDWSGKQLAATGQLGPAPYSNTILVETSHSGTLPSGTRRVRIALSFHFGINNSDTGGSLADNIAFTLAAPGGPPVIFPGGIVSAGAFGGFPSIAPGSWIEIFGANLASATQGWAASDFNNGVAPTALGGVKVSVGGKAAFIDFVSSGQVNALVPSDAPIGPVEITLTNSNGTSDGFGLYVKQTQPGLLAPSAFLVGGKQYVAALFSDGQTFALPQNAIVGVASRPAKAGETLTIYGVGCGPVTGGFTAGTLVTQQNSLTTPVQFLFGLGATPATLPYFGLAPSFTGLYQFNVVVPHVGADNALPISISLGGAPGSQNVYIAVQD